MKIRTLIILLAALALLGGLVYKNRQKKAAGETAGQPSEETLLAPGTLNDIARFTVTMGKETTTVIRADGRWVVANLWNYPADFSRVSENLRKLADIKCGDVLRGGTDHLSEFGLDEAPTNTDGFLPPAVVSFQDADGKVLRKLSMGTPRMTKPTDGRPGFPESSYMRIDDGPVRLVAAYLPSFPRNSIGWIDRSILAVPPADIAEISMTLTNGDAYHVVRKDDASLAVDGLKEGETTKPDGANVLAGAVAQLLLNEIADPALKPDVTGFDKSNTYAVRTKDGLVYTIQVGLPPEGTYGRYVKVGVTNGLAAAKPGEAGPAADAKRVQSEQDRLSKWTFIVLEGSCQNLTLPREQVVAAATNAMEPAAATTNAP